MAGDWIKMRTGLITHPKIVRIRSACKADKLRVIGGLFALWTVFDEHSEDGRLDGYSFDLMDDEIGFPGFCAAVASVGWLVQEGETLVAVEFEAHNGKTAKRRAMDADRKKEVRKVSAPDADKKRTREEKRRSKPPTPENDLPEVDGLNLEAWDRWVEYRTGIKKPIKPVSVPAAQRKLAEFGSFQELVVEQSIANGWQGLFDLKTASGASNPAAAAAANTGDWRDKPMFKGAI